MTRKTADKPHILFLFSDTGGGHRSAARAIIEALEIYHPGKVTTEMLDFFVEYAPPPFDMAVTTYAPMAQVPDLWELGYKLSNGKWRSKLVQDILWPYIRKSTERLVQEHPCDLFLSVHPIINTPILRALGDDHPPYMTVITDMVSTHVFWYNNKATLIMTPTEVAKLRGISIGIDPDRMEIVGQPIADKFRRPTASKSELRDKLGWPQDKTVVLIVGGGDGMGPVEETVRAVDEAGMDLVLAVIAGRNEALKNSLENADLKAQTFIYGFVDNMPDLMNAADILLSKAGPGTISEALLPGCRASFIPRCRQETAMWIMCSMRMQGWAPTAEKVLETLRYWTENPDILQEMAATSKRLAMPDASYDIAQRIIDAVYPD